MKSSEDPEEIMDYVRVHMGRPYRASKVQTPLQWSSRQI